MTLLLKKILVICVAFSSAAAWAAVDPLDTPFWQTFHINTIGVGLGGTPEYRQLMLANTGGTMPRNVKVGMGTYDTALMTAAGGIYDYIPSVFILNWSLDAGRENDLSIGIHLNAMPWNDSEIQSADILHNFLEKHDGGALLQVDRYGRIRKATLAQDPTIDEEAGTFPFMEMQLSLSPYAPLVQDYMLRNTRLTARYFAWLREEAPDIVTFCTMSSEIGQNAFPNWDWCDYSTWSKQEFRDWLSGAGIYAGQGQYPSLGHLNMAFFGGTGFPWASWEAVEPPTTVLWTSDSNGRWWQKWHEFRIAQVRNIEQNQIRATRSAGWSPDRIFGHQIPGDPNSTAEQYTKNASPWTTTFVQEGGGGITTYGASASDTTIFNAVYANDKNWSIGEYNPKSTSITENLNALESVWDSKAHVICPFHWTLEPDHRIKDTAFLTALQQFVGNHANDAFTGMAAYEAAPDSRNVIWTMSYSGDIESATGLGNSTFSNGVYSADITNTAAAISLQLDEARHALASDAYFAASLRMFLGTAPSGATALEWTDTNGVTGSVSFEVKQGWNLCHVNLAEHSAWREKRIREFRLNLPGDAGNDLQLDWVRLEAGHCWHFDDPNEVYGVENFTGWEVANGQFSGTSGADGYIYLATDKQHALEHADRAFIDADYYTKVRVRITSSANASAQLFWWKGDESAYATSFPVSAGTRTYEIDLGATPDWSGLVTRFRLDPVNADGVACAVDFVALSPVLLPPRAPVYDMIANSPNPVFLWDPATEPDHTPLTYDFQLATDFGFTNTLLTTTDQAPTHTTYIGPELNGLHWWRVRSRDALGNVSPWMVPLPLFARVWNGESTDDFTALHGLTDVTASNGIWTATTGSDPYFYLNTGNNNTGAGINADVYKQVQIRIRVDLPGAPSTAQFFFFQGDDINWSNFTVPPDGQWHELTIDLSTHPDWIGYMDRIRIDPTTASGATVSVDWVRLVPSGELAPNQPPALPVLADQSIVAGEELILDAAATDPNAPPQTLAYSLPTAPAGASLNPTSGWFDWRPAIAQSPSTNQIVLTATDSGVPALSATQSFWVAVAMPVQPTFSNPAVSNGQFSMTIAGDSGPDYTILASTNLIDWAAIWTATPPELPFIFSDPASTNFNQRFYRVLLGP